MNKDRRKEIQKAIEHLELAKDQLENACIDEQEYVESIPENMHQGEKYSDAEAAACKLENAVNELENMIQEVEDAAGD